MTSGRPELTGRAPQAIHSAFAVLEEVARAGPGVSAREISASLGMPRATVYRVLNLLVQDEYLVRLPDLSGFALGAKVGRLVGAHRQDTVRETGAILADVRSRVRGGVHLASLKGHRVVVVDVDPDFPLSDPERVASEPGCSALGRLILAEGESRPGHQPVSYAVQVDQLVPGFGCLAAAVRDADGTLVAGLALALPAGRLRDPSALWATVAGDVARLAAVLGRQAVR